MSPERLKAECFDFHITRWCTDFKEGAYSRISTTSVCLDCTLFKKLENLERQVQRIDKNNTDRQMNNVTGDDRVAKLEKEIESKNNDIRKLEKLLTDMRKELEEIKRSKN